MVEKKGERAFFVDSVIRAVEEEGVEEKMCIDLMMYEDPKLFALAL